MADLRRVARLRRLEKVRDVAKQTAAAEAARAEGTLASLEALAARTGRMLADYRVDGALADAGSLRQVTAFRAGLGRVADATGDDAARARSVADARLADLASAERQRQAAQDRAAAAQAAYAAKRREVPLGARRDRPQD